MGVASTRRWRRCSSSMALRSGWRRSRSAFPDAREPRRLPAVLSADEAGSESVLTLKARAALAYHNATNGLTALTAPI